MTTLRLNLSNTAVELNQLNKAVSQLRDNRHPVYYRYNKKNRELGTFYGVFHQQGTTKWIKLGCYPALSAKNSLVIMQKLLQEGALKKIVTDQLEFTTVKELLTWYLERLKNNKSLSQHTKQNQISCIKHHLLPLLGEIGINKLSLPLVDEKLFQPLQTKLALSTVDNAVIVAIIYFAHHSCFYVDSCPPNCPPQIIQLYRTNENVKNNKTPINEALHGLKNSLELTG
jgi:hypothetical protein